MGWISIIIIITHIKYIPDSIFLSDIAYLLYLQE